MAISKVETARQPDIQYAPNYEKWQTRAKHRLATEDLPSTLPEGFPQKLESDLVWDNTDIATRYDWTYQLTHSDVGELESALQHFKSLRKPLGCISQETFPLPTLHPKLRDISREIHHGFGFKVIRGLPVDTYTREDILTLYAGLASHVAPTRGRQDSRYEGKSADVVLTHIKDISTTRVSDQIGSPAYTADKQVFHTDSGDVIALLCLNEAEEGGQSKVSSSWRVYNEIAATRPDLIRTLAEDWPVEVFGDPNTTHTNRPLLYYTPSTTTTIPERLIIQYARRTFTGFASLPRSTSIPPITEAQAEALDTLHFSAEKHALGLDFKKGDIQFVNNLSIFHARDEFTDSVEKKRHLVRLWLRDEGEAWELPKELQGRWDKVYKDVREERQVFPLEAYVRTASLGGR